MSLVKNNNKLITCTSHIIAYIDLYRTTAMRRNIINPNHPINKADIASLFCIFDVVESSKFLHK